MGIQWRRAAASWAWVVLLAAPAQLGILRPEDGVDASHASCIHPVFRSLSGGGSDQQRGHAPHPPGGARGRAQPRLWPPNAPDWTACWGRAEAGATPRGRAILASRTGSCAPAGRGPSARAPSAPARGQCARARPSVERAQRTPRGGYLNRGVALRRAPRRLPAAAHPRHLYSTYHVHGQGYFPTCPRGALPLPSPRAPADFAN